MPRKSSSCDHTVPPLGGCITVGQVLAPNGKKDNSVLLGGHELLLVARLTTLAFYVDNQHIAFVNDFHSQLHVPSIAHVVTVLQ